jgi:hypothetical protein
MPLVIATEAPQGMPADLAAIAEQQDDLIGEEMADLVPRPERPYSAKVYSALTKAIAAAAKVMGLDLTPESYSGPVEAMDADVARFLAMMAAAADDYGKPFPVELSDIKGDSELTAITAALLQLSKDKGFAEFLDAPAEAEEVTEETTIMPDGEVEEEEEEEFDFAKRMRR